MNLKDTRRQSLSSCELVSFLSLCLSLSLSPSLCLSIPLFLVFSSLLSPHLSSFLFSPIPFLSPPLVVGHHLPYLAFLA